MFSPFAQSHRNTSLSQCYKKNEQEKKRAYDQRIREVEHGSFSSLVFSTSGGMGPTANVVYKRIASMIAQKHDKTYSKTLHWIRCKLSYSLLRSATMCLRGARSSIHHPAVSTNIMDLACHEGRVPLHRTLNSVELNPLCILHLINYYIFIDREKKNEHAYYTALRT